MDQPKTWGNGQIHTMTFRFTMEFRRALAASLGRVGDLATIAEVEEFLREAAAVNIKAVIDEHTNGRSRLTAKVRRR